MTRGGTLVTGVSGFVGPHLVRALRTSESRIVGLGLGDAPAGVALDAWHALDIGDLDALTATIARETPDRVTHLAGQSSAGRSFQQPLETFRANTLGTWNLLEAVRRSAPRARVLVVGTGEVYGPQPADTRVAEDAPLRPVSPYALSKCAADAIAEAFAREAGLDVVRTRSFSHAGPGQAPGFAVPSWAHQIAAMERGEQPPVLRVGNLEVTRDLSDVRDIVAAYVALLERGRSGAVYNVCSGRGVRLTEVVAALVGRARVAVEVAMDPELVRPADVPYLVGDPSRIENEIGWSANVPIERTLDEVLDGFREAKA
jgi:GDP-4-dehydro-6-deoxy-D-mannose reductase